MDFCLLDNTSTLTCVTEICSQSPSTNSSKTGCYTKPVYGKQTNKSVATENDEYKLQANSQLECGTKINIWRLINHFLAKTQ